MFDSLKKHCTVSRWQRYNVYLKVNICICEHLSNSTAPMLGFLFMVPERSFVDDSLLGALFFSFTLSFRGEHRLPNGSTACLLGAFVLKDVLTSINKKTKTIPSG